MLNAPPWLHTLSCGRGTPTLVDIIAQIIAARNYVSYYQNHIWIIASYYETLCIIALIIASYYETLCIIALIIASYYETLCIIAQLL